MRPVVVSLAGPPGCGKSHFLLMGFPDPIVVFDYEGGLEDVLLKAKGKEIEVLDRKLPMQWSTRRKNFGKEEWQAFLKDYEEALGRAKTIGIESGTAQWAIVRAAFEEEINKELMTYLYREPNQRMANLVQMARDAGVNLVLTHHVRAVYDGDKPTGEVEPDGFRHLDDLVDWSLRMQLKQLKGAAGPVVVTESFVAKCRFDRRLWGQTFNDLDYDMLCTLVGG